MSLKSKARAARKREHNKRLAEQEQEKVLGNATRLRTLTSGFARTERKAADEQAFKASKMPTYQFDKRVAIKHATDEERFIARQPKLKQLLSPEMQEREKAAQARYEQIKARVGPAYNKGGPQLLTESELAAERRGELRRRS